MSKLFKILGFIFSWISPFGVIYINHIVLTEQQFDVDMFGLLLVMILIIGLIKYIDGRVSTWDIQDKHKIFILNWNNGKKLSIALFLTWILYTIEDDIVKMQWSGVLICSSFIIGWVLTLLGNIKRKKNLD